MPLAGQAKLDWQADYRRRNLKRAAAHAAAGRSRNPTKAREYMRNYMRKRRAKLTT